jgi:hypothetical protein
MSSTEKRQIEAFFKPALKRLGFLKHGATWHHSKGSVIHVVNVQGSQWSKAFYVNLGIFFTQIDMAESPAQHLCHVRARLSDLVPDAGRLANLLDLDEKPLSPADGEELLHLLLRHGIPWLERYSTREGILNAAADKNPPMIRVRARKYFGIAQ